MMFMGEYYHNVDTKGRLIVPVKFREILGEEFIVTKGLDGCLFVFAQSDWEVFEEKLRAMPLASKTSRQFVRFFVSGACECELDKQGRILIPQNLRQFAGLEKDVVLAGAINRVEIWDKEKWMERQKMDEDMDEIAEQMAGLSEGINIMI